MKVAIVHDYLNDYGGAEKLVEAICEIYPNADIHTAVKDKKKLNDAGAFVGKKINAPNINGLLKPFKKFFIYSYPIYFETLDLSKYDLVITSTAHFAKGVITPANTLNICYMHTPTRFLWGLKTETGIRDKWWAKLPLIVADNYLRVWDYVAAQRPDYIVCNSVTVKNRIKKFYKREATVINPFYDSYLAKQEVERIEQHKGDYYFTVSRKGKYKNLALIAKTFNELKKTIYIAGSGSADSELKQYKSKYVKLLGFISEADKVSYLKGCKAFVVATENEDFGITPIEAYSFGKPCIVLKSGGLKETTINGKTGIIFEKPTVKDLSKAINQFEKLKFDSTIIINHAKKYSKDRFKKEFKSFVDLKLAES